VIAVYTFVLVWWRIGTGERAVYIAWIVVGLIWIYEILYISLAAWRFKVDTFFHPTPYWCWTGKYYLAEKIVGEYFWVWLALFASLLLYIPLFFLSRGNITTDDNVWWKFHIHRRSPNAPGLEGERRRSLSMIAYPLLYSIMVVPLSAVRWAGFVQENTGDHRNHIPAAATLAVRVVFGLSGICNVILFLTTRPRLLLFAPSKLEEESTSASTDSEGQIEENVQAGSNPSDATVNARANGHDHRSPGIGNGISNVGNEGHRNMA